MVNMDCSLMWYNKNHFLQSKYISNEFTQNTLLNVFRFKNAREVEQTFLVDPLYLKHEHQGTVPDYRVF